MSAGTERLAQPFSHGLLPIENSVGGSIHRNYDLLLEHDLPIVAETELQVVHNLIALQGTENTMPCLMECVHAYATLGEIIQVMKEELGVYEEPTMI